MQVREWLKNIILLICLFSTTVVSGGSLTILWRANSEPDIAGYFVHMGTQSQTYNTKIDVGLTTKYTLTALHDSTQYYIAVSAYDVWENESELSMEVSGIPGVEKEVPTEITLLPSFPNPFISNTYLMYELPASESIEIRIYNNLGRLIRTIAQVETFTGINPPLLWDGNDNQGIPVPNGIYYCRIVAPDQISNAVHIIRIK